MGSDRSGLARMVYTMSHYRFFFVVIPFSILIGIYATKKDIKAVRELGFWALAVYFWPFMVSSWNNSWNEPFYRRVLVLAFWMWWPLMAYCWLPASMVLTRMAWRTFGATVAYLNNKFFED